MITWTLSGNSEMLHGVEPFSFTLSGTIAKSVNIETGIFLRGNLGIRHDGKMTDYGFEYIAYFARERKAERGCCSDTALRQWGKPITADEAQQFIPNMAEQLMNLQRENSKQGNELAEVLEPVLLRNASDESLIAELEWRGFQVIGKRK